MTEFNQEKRFYRSPMIFLGFLGKLAGMVLIAFIFGYFVMLLWNWLMPAIFHLGVIGYWQGFGIVLLCKLLFGPFRVGYPPHKPWKGNRFWRPNFRDMEYWGGGDDWELKGGWHQWRYYKDYWRSEGKEAFEKYIEKIEKTKEKKK